MDDKLLILEDTNGDGKADKRTVFAGDLNNPTGFEFYNGGVIVAQAPNLVFLKDTNGDDKYDVKADPARRPRHGRHAPHDQQLHVRSGRRALLAGRHLPPDAGRDALGPDRAAGRRRRLPLRAADVEVRGLHPDEFPQPARARVRPAGAATSCSTRRAASRTTGPRSRRRSTTRRWKRTRRRRPGNVRTRPVGGAEILSSRALPRGDAGQHDRRSTRSASGACSTTSCSEDGAGLKWTEAEPILQSADENFRPVDAEVGPDGALYFVDWHNPIIGHMQHNLRDTSRDHDARPRLSRDLSGPAAAHAGEDRGRADRSRCSTC